MTTVTLHKVKKTSSKTVRPAAANRKNQNRRCFFIPVPAAAVFAGN